MNRQQRIDAFVALGERLRDPARQAELAGLRYQADTKPGLTRQPGPDGTFAFLTAKGEEITDEKTLTRLQGFVIPPAWTDVWICTHPRGHIQAVGTDAAGRRQYRYHDEWRLQRDAEAVHQAEEAGFDHCRTPRMMGNWTCSP